MRPGALFGRGHNERICRRYHRFTEIIARGDVDLCLALRRS